MSDRRRADSTRRWFTRRPSVLLALTGALVITGLVVAFGVLPAASDRTPPAELSPARVGGASGCEGIRLEPGSDPQAQLQSQPEGETFCFSSGVYRLARPLTPKDRQRLVGEPGAILSGAQVVTGWTQIDGAWRATGYLPSDPFVHGECMDGYRGCGYAEAVFYDNRQLWRVDTQDELAPNRFFEDYDANAIWIADDPSERTVEVARTETALIGESKDVLVEGLIIEKFANPAQRGAVQAQGPGWRIQNNDVRLNHGHGVYTDSTGGEIVGNRLHHNGQLGLGGDGDYVAVTSNEIDHNNTAGFDILWEAGGMKWFNSTGLKVSHNNVHHNTGPGLWTDINNIHTTYERNNVYNNTNHGIYHELSYHAIIRNNRIVYNEGAEPLSGWGDAGIRVSASRDVEVYGNVLIGNTNAIMLIQQRRNDSPSEYGPHELDNIIIRDNDITMTDNLTGMVNDNGDDSLYRRNIRFSNNTYRLANEDGRYFAWAGDNVTRTTWTQAIGHDRTGKFLTI
ncbi:MAG TPA: right-handed parallel beta-helix repeat-containing protein [Nitrospira sp.]|nr:right-handed parallel beta-helix repeat-containing protein [Nitrospira sp.]